jgi:hypothetical protein
MPGAGPRPRRWLSAERPSCRTTLRALGDVPNPRHRVPLSQKRDGTKDVDGMVTTVLTQAIPCQSDEHDVAAAAGEPLSATEPAQLYGLACLAFVLHLPESDRPGAGISSCVQCGQDWPCPHLRLAYRIREAF